MSWEKLKETVRMAVKWHPDTRWNARRNAVHIVKTKLDEIAKLLEDMASDTAVLVDTRSDTSCLLHNMQTFSKRANFQLSDYAAILRLHPDFH